MYATATAGDGGVRLWRVAQARKTHGGIRGKIMGFSKASRRRLIDRLMFIPWFDFVNKDKHREHAHLVLVTLTYPSKFPTSCAIAHQHVSTWRKRVQRVTKGKVDAMWRMEFQKRGAPHFHILMLFHKAASIARLTEWARRTWYEVVGSGDIRHLAHGADCRAVYVPHSGPAGLVRYLVKYLGKIDTCSQHTGRIWGEWGEIPEVVRAAVVFEYREGFVEFLRRVRKWGKKSRYLRKVHDVHGLRLFGNGTNVLLQLTTGLPGVLAFLT